MRRRVCDPRARIAAMILVTVMGSCGTSRTFTGSGSEVMARVQASLVQDPLPDQSRVRCDDDGASTATATPDRIVYRWWPADAGKFTPSRLVTITITPWDDDPDGRRTVAISATRYHSFPPFIALPAGDAVASVTAAIDAAHDAGPRLHQ